MICFHVANEGGQSWDGAGSRLTDSRKVAVAQVGQCRSVSRASWKIMLPTTTGNVVISEVDARTYVVLSEVEKHVPYGEVVRTTERVTLYPRCHTNEGHYNRVQMYQ
jgi:hypothetical protein